METCTRNATLQDLAAMLQDQATRKLDVVAPATKITSRNGQITISGTQPLLTEDGVSMGDGTYVPTEVCDEGLAAKLGVPVGYLKRCRTDRPDLYDANLNGWLAGSKPLYRHDPDEPGGMKAIRPGFDPDHRSFLVRCFRDDDNGTGIARAFLSDRYAVIDHLDALTAALDGVKQAGVEVNIDSCDLTDRRMYVRVVAPEIQALAPVLLKGYRSPFTGDQADDNPVVFAGFEIGNSETGGGAFTITPRLVVEVCKNGLKITRDALRAVHLGGRQDEGAVKWSEGTLRKTVELITSRTKDAVSTFLDTSYMERVIAELEETAETKVADPAATVKFVSKKLVFSDDIQKSVLDFFIQGGQMSCAGVLNAITATAQTITDADLAAEMEGLGIRAMELAASR